ncbi:MAG TPA: hypothetical protein PKE31_05010, partial [Pseudomonadota bacterium]|nr:hypothetical protein [Pseudomonadota bacterium]
MAEDEPPALGRTKGDSRVSIGCWRFRTHMLQGPEHRGTTGQFLLLRFERCQFRLGLMDATNGWVLPPPHARRFAKSVSAVAAQAFLP